jgi:hypothetical protein
MNKYTKAELISKFKRLEKKSSNSTQITQGIISKFLLFKRSLILKRTLIALLIKWFKKYSLIRKLWMIVNTTIMSLFGISLIDVYGFDILSYFRDNSIYAWFSGLLSTPKINKPHESIPSFMRETNKNATGIYLIIPLFIAIINFSVATLKLIGDPNNIFLKFVQIFCLLTIIFIVAYNVWILFLKIFAQWL